MGIVLGLLTALSWGSSDFLARFATRTIGTFRAMLYMQLTGLLMLTAALHWLGGWGHLVGFGWKPWAWGVGVGLLNTTGTLALYRSFEVGKMSIVAPISASYPALTMLLAATTGERLTLRRLLGFALILLGVVLVARGESTQEDPRSSAGNPTHRGKHSGVNWALLSALTFGVMFWILGTRAVPLLGSAQTVWLIRLTCIVLTLVVMFVLHQPKALPKVTARWTLLGMGLLDTGAYVLNNYGMQLEQVSVVSVLASLYGAVTVGLAATVLKEKVSRIQWAGIVAIFSGIALISR
jgi:drug/metabolite transporter (DMT)-like permease